MTLTIFRNKVATVIQLADGSYLAAKGTTTNIREARLWSSSGHARRFMKLNGIEGRLDFLPTIMLNK